MKVLVELDVVDALTVGLSLRTVARGDAMQTEARGTYERVGVALINAARSAPPAPEAEWGWSPYGVAS